MIKRFLFSVLLAAGFWSCKDMETKKVSSETILARELKEIDMKEVDEYPSIAGCDTLATRSSRSACFKRELSRNFQKFLAGKILVFSEPVHDTIWLDLSITAEGEPKINTIKIPDSLEEEVPRMKEWLRQSLDSFPNIYPAIKRGIPVRTTFKMPVVIEVE